MYFAVQHLPGCANKPSHAVVCSCLTQRKISWCSNTHSNVSIRQVKWRQVTARLSHFRNRLKKSKAIFALLWPCGKGRSLSCPRCSQAAPSPSCSSRAVTLAPQTVLLCPSTNNTIIIEVQPVLRNPIHPASSQPSRLLLNRSMS